MNTINYEKYPKFVIKSKFGRAKTTNLFEDMGREIALFISAVGLMYIGIAILFANYIPHTDDLLRTKNHFFVTANSFAILVSVLILVFASLGLFGLMITRLQTFIVLMFAGFPIMFVYIIMSYTFTQVPFYYKLLFLLGFLLLTFIALRSRYSNPPRFKLVADGPNQRLIIKRQQLPITPQSRLALIRDFKISGIAKCRSRRSESGPKTYYYDYSEHKVVSWRAVLDGNIIYDSQNHPAGEKSYYWGWLDEGLRKIAIYFNIQYSDMSGLYPLHINTPEGDEKTREYAESDQGRWLGRKSNTVSLPIHEQQGENTKIIRSQGNYELVFLPENNSRFMIPLFILSTMAVLFYSIELIYAISLLKQLHFTYSATDLQAPFSLILIGILLIFISGLGSTNYYIFRITPKKLKLVQRPTIPVELGKTYKIEDISELVPVKLFDKLSYPVPQNPGPQDERQSWEAYVVPLPDTEATYNLELLLTTGRVPIRGKYTYNQAMQIVTVFQQYKNIDQGRVIDLFNLADLPSRGKLGSVYLVDIAEYWGISPRDASTIISSLVQKGRLNILETRGTNLETTEYQLRPWDYYQKKTSLTVKSDQLRDIISSHQQLSITNLAEILQVADHTDLQLFLLDQNGFKINRNTIIFDPDLIADEIDALIQSFENFGLTMQQR